MNALQRKAMTRHEPFQPSASFVRMGVLLALGLACGCSRPQTNCELAEPSIKALETVKSDWLSGAPQSQLLIDTNDAAAKVNSLIEANPTLAQAKWVDSLSESALYFRFACSRFGSDSSRIQAINDLANAEKLLGPR